MRIFRTLLISLALVALIAPQAHALEISVQNLDFSKAEKNPSYIRFDLDTKKFGFFKSSVSGFVKNFKITFDESTTGYQTVGLNFKIRDMDTDLFARNDQMWNLCFEEKKFPELSLKILGTLTKSSAEKNIEADANIKGIQRRLSFIYSTAESDEKKTVSGSAIVSLQSLGIKDPSIGIANVEDKVKVQFHFVVP